MQTNPQHSTRRHSEWKYIIKRSKFNICVTYRFFLTAVLCKRFSWMILIGIGDRYCFLNEQKEMEKTYKWWKRIRHVWVSNKSADVRVQWTTVVVDRKLCFEMWWCVPWLFSSTYLNISWIRLQWSFAFDYWRLRYCDVLSCWWQSCCKWSKRDNWCCIVRVSNGASPL